MRMGLRAISLGAVLIAGPGSAQDTDAFPAPPSVILSAGSLTLPIVPPWPLAAWGSATGEWRVSRWAGLAAGGLYAPPLWEGRPTSALFGAVDLGPPDNRTRIGVGIAEGRSLRVLPSEATERGGEPRRHTLVIVEHRIVASRHTAFVAGAFLFVGGAFNPDEQPLRLGVSVFGGGVSADVGVVVPGLACPLPFPVVSVSYRFELPGRRRR